MDNLKNEIINETSFDFSLLQKRGPDSFKIERVELGDSFVLLFAASVLSLRGNHESQVTVQPMVCPISGNILLWNGEIFRTSAFTLGDHENDGARLFDHLNQKIVSGSEDLSLLETFELISGPYAFVYYVHSTRSVYFARDRFGRRSLLVNAAARDESERAPLLTLSSVRVKSLIELEFQELKANGIYKASFKDAKMKITWYPWERAHTAEDSIANSFKSQLIRSDLFIRDRIREFNEQVIQPESRSDARMAKLCDEFYSVLKESVSRRLRNIPNYCKSCSRDHSHIKFDSGDEVGEAANKTCAHAKCAVMFSGGIDSAVLAALADECLPPDEPIDLLNVAFEMTNQTDVNKRFLVPDRITGIECLKQFNPNRKWNFVKINVKLDELRKERDSVIKHLLYPHQTVLDDSIGCALWFASRGRGLLHDTDTAYTSQAEVLLLGMGADEQLAGYARHRGRFDMHGLAGLAAEVKMEMQRISERNLGRDDRILSDHGKESRLPFLDEDVVSYLNSLEIGDKCDMSRPRGEGEKYLLRYLGRTRLGLTYAARLEKRAIQFGSRVAKAENNKEKASDVCERIV